MFELLGICLLLSSMLALNLGTRLLATLCWHAGQSRIQYWAAARRARWLFALRVLPGAVALGGSALLLVPAFWVHEPRHEAAEEVSFKLGALTLLSAAGLVWPLLRGVASCQATRRITREWLRQSVPLRLPQAPIPAFRLFHPFPVVAVVGVWRPRLFIADRLLQELTADELHAAIAHECGHLVARDNLKRCLMQACRDALWFVPGRTRLDQQWAAAAEEAADQYVARAGALQAINLASALIKVARLIPVGMRLTMPAGALLVHDGDDVARRVRLLAEAATNRMNKIGEQQPRSHAPSFQFALSAVAGVALWLASNSLETIHRVMETVVASLQ